MGRTRIISANKAIYTTPTGLLPSFYGDFEDAPLSGLKARQLNRIDTLSFDIDIASARSDINVFGQNARIASLRTSDINPTISMGYYLTDGRNEHELGLNVSGLTNAQATDSQFISGILTEEKVKRSRNIYALVAPEGQDAFNQSAATHSNNPDQDVITFGNCFLTNYSVGISVGEIPRADVEFVASNVSFITGHNSGVTAFLLNNPALTKDASGPADSGTWALPIATTGTSEIDVLKPGDVTVTFSESSDGLEIGGIDLSDICIQSLTLDLPLSRTPIECLGDEFAVSQSLDTPIDVTLGVNAFVRDFNTGNLQQILLNAVDGQKQDITINIKDRNDSTKTSLVYVIKDAILDSQNFSLGLDDNETVDLQFSSQVAGATNSTVGLFCSGQHMWGSEGLSEYGASDFYDSTA